jgi:hypothetical protein
VPETNQGRSLEYFKYCLYLHSAALTTYALIFFVVPHNGYFLYSYLPEGWKNAGTYLLFGICLEARSMFQAIGLVNLTLTYTYVYFTGSMYWLSEIR